MSCSVDLFKECTQSVKLVVESRVERQKFIRNQEKRSEKKVLLVSCSDTNKCRASASHEKEDIYTQNMILNQKMSL